MSTNLRRFHGLSNNLRALQIRKLKDVKGRIIIVGDVHGCSNELNALMERCKYSREKGDVLIMVGDYVNKGYDSISVVKRCIELGAYGVLGNHDFTLLHVADGIDAGLQQEELSHLAAGTTQGKRDAVLDLARTMPYDCISYLRQLPHIIRIPQHKVIVVHAGINVAVPLEQQDVFDVMHIRTIVEGRDGIKRGSYGDKGEPWASLYEGPEKIIFGHDARTGFKEYKHALALDSGCVYGNSLTAVIYSSENPGKGVVVSVPSQYNVKAAETKATAAPAVSPGDSPAPIVMNTHAVISEIRRGFGADAASTPVTLAPPSRTASLGVFGKSTASAGTAGSNMATPSSLPAVSASARAVAYPAGSPSPSMEVLAVMVSTVKTLIAAGMLDSIAVLSKIPSYNARWEDVLATESAELGKNDWDMVVEQLFVTLSDIVATGAEGIASPASPAVNVGSIASSNGRMTEEERVVAYLNLITDIIDVRGPEAVENVAAMAHAAVDGVKRRYPSHARLIKQVKLALP